MKKKEQKTKTLKAFILVLAMLLLVISCFWVFIFFKLNSIRDTEPNATSSNATNYKEVEGITNILLVGLDARTLEERSRSDSMMIVTVDNRNKSIKITSLARDTYVNIPGRGMEKLTHAYAYGGISLLSETVETNFEVDINNYAIVNFNSFVDIIDAVGGTEINVQKKDLKELNKIIKDSYIFKENKDGKVKLIKEEGLQHLNGYQSLAYARIRKHDSAFNRDERQRELLESLMTRLKTLSPTKYNSLLNSILPSIKTDTKPMDILNLAFTVFSIDNLNVKQLEFPLLDYSDGRVRQNKGWVLDFKKELCLKVLHDFIFEDITYTDDELRNLNAEMISNYNSKYTESDDTEPHTIPDKSDNFDADNNIDTNTNSEINDDFNIDNDINSGGEDDSNIDIEDDFDVDIEDDFDVDIEDDFNL